MKTETPYPSASELIQRITQCIDMHKDDPSLQNPSYETGLLGFSLYYLYLAQYEKNTAHYAPGEIFFERGIASLDLKNFRKIYTTDSLDAHLSHIGRFVIYCRAHQLLDIDADAYLEQLDDILFGLMKSKISVRDFDTGSGAMAAGTYFLARAKSGTNQVEKIEQLVHGLGSFARKDKDGDYYWEYPLMGNRVYLGISHGSALMISFLVRAHALNIAPELCRKIMGKACNFLRKQYRKTMFRGLFPNRVDDPVEPMQFALCYGDLGNGYALYRAAEILDDPELKSFANMILDDCLLRTKEDGLTLDAGILYGAAGLGIAFEKMATVSGEGKFAQRAQYWYDQIPRYFVNDNQFAGFSSRHQTGETIWNVAFGWGILGTGIALMRAQNKSLPALADLTYIA